MKERIVLLAIILGLGVFLYFFQSYFNTLWGLVFLCITMVIYTFYMQLATLHKKRKLKKNPQVINENFKPFVTVMIPAHNEEGVITQTVQNILEMNYEKFEVIVIDDRSEDNTASVIRDLESKYEKVRALVREKEAFPGKSAVLNDALVLAKGEAILVLDADARVAPDFLSKLVPNLEPADVGAVQARKVILNKDFNCLTRCQNNEYTLDTHFQIGRDAVKGAVELRGNGELVRRTALEDIGGWNNYTITDDLDMSTQLHIKGWDVRFCPEAIVYEEGIIYLVPLFRQRRRWLEGSIRRYLEHFGEVLNSKEMSLRASLDMTAYISEFLMPFWFVMEVCLQIFRVATKSAPTNCILSSLILACAIAICFTLAARYSLRRYDNLSRPQALKQAVETSIYLFFVWFPLVMFICLKILFCKKDMNWGKTTHGLVLEEELHMQEQQELQKA
ncbi:MAG: glycosyltransferase family 2 protein [Candidatus Gastranaerophilaceae bacterium]